MKTTLILSCCLCFISFAFSQTPGEKPSTFNPTLKMHGLVHARYESSLTDSVDVQGLFSATPVQSNFRLQRLELRADISLTDKWSGVIRAQLPDLKTSTPGRMIELAYFQFAWMDEFNIRGGQMKVPFELDELTSHEDLRMIDRGPTSRMFVSQNYASYQPGLMIYGTFLKEKMPLSYYAGVFNGSDRSVPYDNNSGKNISGRLEFKPIKSLRLGVNDQLAVIKEGVTGNALGGDVSLQQKLNEKLLLILEGEYIQGVSISTYNNSSDTVKEVNDFKMRGYFAQALLRIDIMQTWCRTFEIGGRFESTDPLTSTDDNEFSTVTGGIGFIFLPENDARLQLNLVHTNYKTEVPGSLKNNLMFVTNLQLRM